MDFRSSTIPGLSTRSLSTGRRRASYLKPDFSGTPQNYFQFDRCSPGTRKIGDPQIHLERSLSGAAKQTSKTSSGASALAARLAQTDSDKVTEPIRAEIVELVYPFKKVRRHQEGEVTPASSRRCVHDPVCQFAENVVLSNFSVGCGEGYLIPERPIAPGRKTRWAGSPRSNRDCCNRYPIAVFSPGTRCHRPKFPFFSWNKSRS